MFTRKNSRLKRMTTLAILLALVVPALVTATVVINYEFNTNTSGVSPNIFLAEGPNYATASNMGLLSATSSIVSGQNYVHAGAVTVNTVTGASNVYMLNALEVYNTSGWGTGTHAVSLWINGTLPSGVTLYYSTSEVTMGTLSGATALSGSISSGPILISSTGAVLYFSFGLTGAATGSGTLTFNFTVD